MYGQLSSIPSDLLGFFHEFIRFYENTHMNDQNGWSSISESEQHKAGDKRMMMTCTQWMSSCTKFIPVRRRAQTDEFVTSLFSWRQSSVSFWWFWIVNNTRRISLTVVLHAYKLCMLYFAWSEPVWLASDRKLTRTISMTSISRSREGEEGVSVSLVLCVCCSQILFSFVDTSLLSYVQGRSLSDFNGRTGWSCPQRGRAEYFL